MQAEALEKSAMLNKAYKTFKNPDETIKYVLREKQLMEEEEKYELPPDFLMEVLEINESLMDADGADGKESITKRIDAIGEEIYAPVSSIIEGYSEGVTTEEDLLRVKEYYYKKKYLDRIRHQLSGMA